MMNELLYVLGYVGLFRVFIYAIGEPHATFNPKAILSIYSYILCSLRASFLSLDVTLKIERPKTPIERIQAREMHKSYVVESVMPWAGVTNMLGLCPTCTSVWFYGAVILLPNLEYGIVPAITLYGTALLLSKLSIKWI